MSYRQNSADQQIARLGIEGKPNQGQPEQLQQVLSDQSISRGDGDQAGWPRRTQSSLFRVHFKIIIQPGHCCLIKQYEVCNCI